jgi:cell division initiation protein
VKIGPHDIRRREFKRSVRGYVDEEVDEFLDVVANEFERLFQENAELEDRVHVLQEQVAGHTHIRQALEKTLVAAQLQSEEIRSNAEKEGQSILRDAEDKAKGIVSELYSQTQRVQQTLMQLKLIEEDFRFKFRALLEGYLRILDEGPVLLSGLETRLVAYSDPGARGPSGADGSPAVMSREDTRPRGDDNPTLETEEASVLGASTIGSAATEKQKMAEGQAAAQPDRRVSTRAVDDTTEEFTVESASPEGKGHAEGPEAKKAGGDGTETGMFFGGQAIGADDSFSGNEARPAKVRDFEW